MRQIKSCHSTGISARLYLESKVAETISLIVEKTKTKQRPLCHQVATQDLENLQSVTSHIKANLSRKMQIAELSKIAHMGTTKLNYTFR